MVIHLTLGGQVGVGKKGSIPYAGPSGACYAQMAPGCVAKEEPEERPGQSRPFEM